MMKTPLIKFNALLLFTFLFIGLSSCGKFAPYKGQTTETWNNVELNAKDTRGNNTIFALATKATAFKALLAGKPFNDSLRIIVGEYEQKEVKDPVKDNATGTETYVMKTRTLFILTEHEKGILSRVFPILQIATKTVVSKDDKVVYEVAGKDVSPTTEYEYQVQDLKKEDKARTDAFAAKIGELYKVGNTAECVNHEDEKNGEKIKMKLCRVSAAAVTLVQKASEHIDSLAEKIDAKIKSGEFKFDNFARRMVKFKQNSVTKEAKDIELIGFVRAADEDKALAAPDAVSAWVIRIDPKAKKAGEKAKDQEVAVNFVKREKDAKINGPLNFR
jgi:hypothetical protein